MAFGHSKTVQYRIIARSGPSTTLLQLSRAAPGDGGSDLGDRFAGLANAAYQREERMDHPGITRAAYRDTGFLQPAGKRLTLIPQRIKFGGYYQARGHARQAPGQKGRGIRVGSVLG